MASSGPVSLENLKANQWIVIHGRVYDIAAFDDHPGGKEVLLSLAGRDATADFEDVGHSDSARKQALSFFVGFFEDHSLDRKELPSVAEISSAPVSSPFGLSTSIVALSSMLAIFSAIGAYFAFGVKKN